MVAVQWLEREGRFSCSTKKKLIGRRHPSCQDRGQSDNLVSIDQCTQTHWRKFRNCQRKSVLGVLRCANSNLGWCGTQCKKCMNGRSWIRLKGPGDLHGQEAFRAVVAIYTSHWVSTRPPQAVTRENFAQLRISRLRLVVKVDNTLWAVKHIYPNLISSPLPPRHSCGIQERVAPLPPPLLQEGISWSELSNQTTKSPLSRQSPIGLEWTLVYKLVPFRFRGQWVTIVMGKEDRSK